MAVIATHVCEHHHGIEEYNILSANEYAQQGLSIGEIRRYLRNIKKSERAGVLRYNVRFDRRLKAQGRQAARAYEEDGEARFDDAAMLTLLDAVWLRQGRQARVAVGTLLKRRLDPWNPEAHLAARLAMIGDESRRLITQTIAEGHAVGLTPREIARGTGSRAKALAADTGWRPIRDTIRQAGPEDRTVGWRADRIARTEVAESRNTATLAGYQELGVRNVRVHDGPDCGWTSHDDPDKADGTIRTLAQADAQRLSHPNCVRAFSPIVE